MMNADDSDWTTLPNTLKYNFEEKKVNNLEHDISGELNYEQIES